MDHDFANLHCHMASFRINCFPAFHHFNCIYTSPVLIFIHGNSIKVVSVPSVINPSLLNLQHRNPDYFPLITSAYQLSASPAQSALNADTEDTNSGHLRLPYLVSQPNQKRCGLRLLMLGWKFVLPPYTGKKSSSRHDLMICNALFTIGGHFRFLCSSNTPLRSTLLL
jgi:hypothetical protein